MAGQVKVNPANLERAANNLKGIADEALGVKSLLSQAENTVGAAWHSVYTNPYLAEVRLVKANMEKIAQKLNSLAASLKKEAAYVRKVEEENKKAFAANRGSGGGGW